MKESMTERRYGRWAGNPEGLPEIKTDCIESVNPSGFIPQQCSRKRGFGKDGLYCKQHAKRHPADEAGAK